VAVNTKVIIEVLFTKGLIPVSLMVLWVLLISRRIEEKREKTKENLLDRLEILEHKD
jgi:hypothetical protein